VEKAAGAAFGAEPHGAAWTVARDIATRVRDMAHGAPACAERPIVLLMPA